MSEPKSFLQLFFDASLIPSDTNDERLRHYQAAAVDLAKRFEEVPRDAVSASLVAIDPACPATDPWFTTVQEAVKLHWRTFLIKHHDSPRQICRAILLEALSNVTKEDLNATHAIWNAASSLMPHLGDGQEQTITREFISRLGDECETHSSTEWRIGAVENLPGFEIKLPTIQIGEVNDDKLLKGMMAASGPNNDQGQALPNANQYWPTSGHAWSIQFAPKATKAIATAISGALTEIGPAIEGLNKQLAPALKKYGSALGKWVVESTQRNERFTALLWWKQALYSPSLQRSYRELPPATIAIAVSFDLGGVSGAPVPLSVEHFLREIIRNVSPENPKLTLAELIATTTTGDGIDPCLPATPTGPARRISLREFLSVVRQGVPVDEMTPAFLGIVPSTSLPLSEWAVWLLRDRLAEILTAPETST